MFGRRYRLRRLHRLHRLDDWGAWGHVADFGGGFGRSRWQRRRGVFRRRSRGPGVLSILLAGLAVFALIRMMSAANRSSRSTFEKAILGVLIAAAAGLILTLRRSSARHQW